MFREDIVELQWVFRVIRRWLWLIVGCTLLGATSAFLVTSWMPPVYSASATLLVHVAPSSMADYSAILTSERLALTYSQMLRGRPVMEAVIARLELEETPVELAKRVKVTPIADTQLIRLSVEHSDPTRAAWIANAIAEVFIAQIQELGRRGLALRTDVVVVETAQVPENPVRRRTLYTTLAALVGAMLAVGMAFLLEHLNDTIKAPDDVSQTLGLGTLGTIGRLAKGEEELIVVARPSSSVAETFHALCTNVYFSSSVDRPLRTLLVTSPGPLEGKSITVANLAAAMAQAGLKVVAVDADLRRPRLHQLFGLDLPGEGTGKSTPWGLTGSLLEGCADGQLHPTQVEGLKVLPSGELAPNPIEMIGTQRMHKLLHDLAQQVDMVLVDSPPVLPVADAAALAPAVDGVLLVLEAGRTPREAARHAVENLRQVGANLVGVVLNGVSTHKGSYYHYHYQYYRDGDKRRKRPAS
jgi:capsular exopolysaccharide synthesis family protein